ncbi:helix-turn-helix domain-containing protein [Cuspidothrix issatschenkoi]|uniref:helix-turn-helix domain-containing protein n=1 Tax=Cuspidothrix issatschenkoi TaxID=230752 RepID=UPI001D14B016|nr:helix-turn-helix domain-containing protein [Cuspidothrix issatschenkoi]
MLRVVKVRLYPNAQQRQSLAQAFGSCRWLWNYFLKENQRFVNCSTVPFIVCADAQNDSRDVSQLTLHSSHHQTEYSFGGGLLEV